MAELAYLRVETLAVGEPDATGDALARLSLPGAAPPDRAGQLPPTRPAAILAEVAGEALSRTGMFEDRRAGISGAPARGAGATLRLEAADIRSHARASLQRRRAPSGAVRAGEREPGPAPDPDADRLAASLDLVADIMEAGSGALEVTMAGGSTERALDSAPATPMGVEVQVTNEQGIDGVVDQHDMRRLARYWELGARTVDCRTVVRMDGDARTQFLPPSPDTARADRVHAAIALVAMTLWPSLLLAAGALVAAVARLRARAWRAPRLVEEHAERVGASADEAGSFTLRELLDASWQFFALGRVVFESPTSGPAAALRTMIHPSGDIETTIRLGDVDDELVDLHGRTIELWTKRLTVTLAGLRRLLDRVAILASAVAAASAGAALIDGRQALALVVGLGGVVLSFAFRSILRLYLRRKLVSILRDSTDRIEVPATQP